MERWDDGVYAIRGKGAADALPLILSAGVHGNEAGPARALESLQQQLLERTLIPQRPLLLILANPPALLNGSRFIKTNLNRLFGAPVRPPGYEAKRSLALEQHCREFAELYGVGWHLDLHAATKPSLHAHFAMMPACERHYEDAWAPLLAQHGFTALVRQKSPVHTFAHFTCTQMGYESFTLECGTVRGTDAGLHAVLNSLLQALLQEAPFANPGVSTLQQYEVVQDLIKQHDAFRFLVDEDSVDFATFTQDTPLAQNGDEVVTSPFDRCALLFANSQVPVGDRAGMLLQEIPGA